MLGRRHRPIFPPFLSYDVARCVKGEEGRMRVGFGVEGGGMVLYRNGARERAGAWRKGTECDA